MRIHAFFASHRWVVLLLGCALVIGSAQACGGKVVVDVGASPGSGGHGGHGGQGGHGGHGGAGGGPSDACKSVGPASPTCKTEGARCAYGDTGCFLTWTCMSGMWSEGTGCYSSSAVGGG